MVGNREAVLVPHAVEREVNDVHGVVVVVGNLGEAALEDLHGLAVVDAAVVSAAALCAHICCSGVVRSSSKPRYAAEPPASGRAPAGHGLLVPRGEGTGTAELAGEEARLAHNSRKLMIGK